MHRQLSGNQTLVEKSSQRLIEGLHSVHILARLHHGIDLMDLVLTNQISDGGIGNQDLHSQGPATAIGAGKQSLAKDALERKRQLRAYLSLLHRRKHVDDAVDS